MNPAEFVVCGKGCWRNIPFTLVDRGQNVKSPDCNRCVANAWRSEKNADEAVGMTSDTKTERKRATFYWLATALLVPELVLGGIWDVLRVPRVRKVIERFRLPHIFPRHFGCLETTRRSCAGHSAFPRLKEWPYAGVVFNLTGALVPHVASGDIEPGPMAYLVVMLGATAASWSLRPPSRRNFRLS
jgi:hypothetical protein